MTALRIGIPLALATAISLCGSLACKDDGPRLPADDEPAGTVIAVTGSAELQTDSGTTRTLRVGDRVKGPDLVLTGPNSSVTIQLFHNHAHWGLGENKRKRVRESKAWRLPKDTSKPLLSGDVGRNVTAAAGRHAEREAADTRATALPDTQLAPGNPEIGRDEGRVARVEEKTLRHQDGKQTGDKAVGKPAGDVSEHDVDGQGGSGGGPTTEEDPHGEGARPAQVTMSIPDRAPKDVEMQDDGAAGGVSASSRPRLQLGETRTARRSLPKAASRAPVRDYTAAIREALEARLGDIAQCRGSGPAKRIAIELTLSLKPPGKLTEVKAQSKDKQLNECAEKSLEKVEFTSLKLARPVTVKQIVIWTEK